MPATAPPPGFKNAKLDIETIPAGERFGRIYLDAYPNPLGFGKSPSRFSDPRRRIAANRFGVLYLGETLKVCFLEALLRDRRDGQIGDLPIEEIEIHTRRFAEIETIEDLRLVDLRDDHAVRMGVPSDVAKASRQSLARAWSLAFYEHKSSPDGIIYPSRLNGHVNLAVYDHAVSKLAAKRVVPLRADRSRSLRQPSRPRWARPETSKRNRTMANIGTFTTTKSGFTGQIKTLALNVKARFERVENPSDNGPQFRIFSGAVELGAAWQKQAKGTERDYLSVKLDDPSFPAPIYATLVEVEGEEGMQLIWSRPNTNRD